MSSDESKAGCKVNGTSLMIEGDVIDILSGFEPNTFDACFCDPPYLLEFMGKQFDKQHKQMQGANDGQRMQAWHAAWCREVYRVLKPGAFVLAFGGTRTVHRLASALEDVGFEVRDTLCYLYGAGFPKSLAIDKAIDKMRGAKREAVGVRVYGDGHIQKSSVLSRPIGTFEMTAGDQRLETLPASEESSRWQGYGTALKPAHEPLVLAMKLAEGTFASNALAWGVAGLNIDGSRVQTGESTRRVNRAANSYMRQDIGGRQEDVGEYRTGSDSGRWPANLLLSHSENCTDTECHPECPVRLLDESTSHLHSAGFAQPPQEKWKRDQYDGIMNWGAGRACGSRVGDAGGGASRFFYTAKVSTRERNLGGIDCKHPTLKPLSLTEYLSRLLLPPYRADGSLRQLIVPFAGAGSEVAGALRAGWDLVIGIEREPEYVQWAEARIAAGVQETEAGVRAPSAKRVQAPAEVESAVVEEASETEDSDVDGAS